MHMNFESIEEVFDSLDGIINEIKKLESKKIIYIAPR